MLNTESNLLNGFGIESIVFDEGDNVIFTNLLFDLLLLIGAVFLFAKQFHGPIFSLLNLNL